MIVDRKQAAYAPMLVIGLGGSGIRILQHLKSMLTQELGAEELANQPVIFLGFDFDRGSNDRLAATPLDSTEFHFFDPQPIAKALANQQTGRRLADQLLGFPLPDDIRYMQAEMAGAGQWRSLGHLGALLHNRHITEALHEAMIRLDQASPPFESLTALIVASIAGGTGAGLFLEVAAILRRLEFRGAIDAVLLLPETFDALPFRERILQNAFGALIEVAAQQSAPIELPTDAHGELLRRPFRRIYLEGPWIGDRRLSAEPEPTYARVAETIRAMSAGSVHRSRLTAEANAPNTLPGCEESASVFSTIASSVLPPNFSSEAIRNHVSRCKTIVFREGRANSPCATVVATLAVPGELRSDHSYIREITDTCRSILGAATTVVDDDSGIGDAMTLVVEYLFYPMEAIAGIDKYRASYRLSTEPVSFHVHKDWPLLLQPFIQTYSWENQPKRAPQTFKSERRPFINYAHKVQAQAQDCHTVFVSYSWDSEEHKQWVLGVANALAREPDIEVTFDQFDVWAGKDLTHFMERGLECERVVVVSTPTYVGKSRERVGGVGYECSLITADLVKDMRQDTFIPILRAGEDVPAFLGSKLRLDFRDDTRFEESMRRLTAAIRREPDARRPEKRSAGDLTTGVAPSQAEIPYRARTRTSSPQIVLEGRFAHRESQGRRQGMYIHNVGDAAALEVHIEPLGHEPKWMMFEKVAVVRPDTNPVEVPIAFVDAADVFEIGAYISMISTLRGGATITDDVAAHDAHPLRITYRDREGTEYVNDEYELHFHESTPFIAANAYYEVQRRRSAPAAERIPPKSERIPAAAVRPRIRLSRSQRVVEKPVDTKTMMQGLYIPLFDVRNSGEEEAFDVLVTLHPTSDLTVTSRRIDHLPAGGEKAVVHRDLRYERNGVATGQLNLWIYITTANMGEPKIRLPLRALVSYRDRRNKHYTTMYDVDGEACTFITDEE